MKDKWNLSAAYGGPLDPEFDEKLDAIAGGDESGSGYCFVSQERDLSWNFDELEVAEISAQRMAEIPRIKCVTLTLYNEEGEIEEEKVIKDE